jgi:hypothetical protein
MAGIETSLSRAFAPNPAQSRHRCGGRQPVEGLRAVGGPKDPPALLRSGVIERKIN